jgi:hypothetical protein
LKPADVWKETAVHQFHNLGVFENFLADKRSKRRFYIQGKRVENVSCWLFARVVCRDLHETNEAFVRLPGVVFDIDANQPACLEVFRGKLKSLQGWHENVVAWLVWCDVELRNLNKLTRFQRFQSCFCHICFYFLSSQWVWVLVLNLLGEFAFEAALRAQKYDKNKEPKQASLSSRVHLNTIPGES